MNLIENLAKVEIKISITLKIIPTINGPYSPYSNFLYILFIELFLLRLQNMLDDLSIFPHKNKYLVCDVSFFPCICNLFIGLVTQVLS